MSEEVELRIRKLGRQLPRAPVPVGVYVPVLRVGNSVVTSGQLPSDEQGIVFAGKVGDQLSVNEGVKAAEMCTLNALAQIKQCIGDLDRVKQIVRVDGYVNSATNFHDQPKVLNGASKLLHDIFGDCGKHTRVAVGVAELPLNAAVEVALWVELDSE